MPVNSLPHDVGRDLFLLLQKIAEKRQVIIAIKRVYGIGKTIKTYLGGIYGTIK